MPPNSSSIPTTHQTAKTHYISSPNHGTTYAYRRFGATSSTAFPPLLFLIHFRGTMDYWDPLLINTIASTREVILLDQSGVGQSSGTVQPTIKAMSADVLSFLALLPDLNVVDVLGFSMGGYVAQLVALDAEGNTNGRVRVRKLVLAGTGTSYGADLQLNSPERAKQVTGYATVPEPDYDNCFHWLFFHPDSKSSQAAGKAWWKRVHERSEATSGEARSKLVSWKYADGGAGLKAMAGAGVSFLDPKEVADGAFERLPELGTSTNAVFIAQGVDDYMIPTSQSVLMQQRIPNARLKIFPDAGHGFLYQFAEEFGGDVVRFLDGEGGASL